MCILYRQCVDSLRFVGESSERGTLMETPSSVVSTQPPSAECASRCTGSAVDVMSVIATIMAICTPFIYDDERKIAASDGDEEGAKNKAQEEIQAAKDAMLEQPNAMVNACTLFFGFLIMFIMYGAQQYTKQFGITNLGLVWSPPSPHPPPSRSPIGA